MIVDAHGHHVRRSYMPETWWVGYAEMQVREPQRRRGQPVPPLADTTQKLVDWFESLSGDDLVQQMDAAGIDQMVLLPLDFGLLLGEAPTPIEQQNYEYAMLARKYSGRLIAFIGVDPRRGREGLDLFERGVREWGARGLKIHPAAGFFLNDPACYPFYRMAVDLDVPVMVHTGFEPPPARSRFGDPLYLDDVCSDFPRLRVVAAHMGLFPFWRPQLIQLARFHAGLRVDISALQPLYREDPGEFFRTLRRDLNFLGPHKILFGSDHPYFAGRKLGLAQWVEALRNPPELTRELGIIFNDSEIEGLLAGNANAWLAGSGDHS